MLSASLSLLPSLLLSGLREALEWPLLAWLKCHEPVELLHPDGRREVFVAGRPSSGHAAPAFRAVLLPADEVLFLDLALPDLPEGELLEAVALEVERASPFQLADTVWGMRTRRISDVRLSVRVALTARQTALTRIDAVGGPGARPEVWADAGDPVVIGGFGEAARRTAERRSERFRFVLMALVLAGFCALAVLPFLQLRGVVLDAQRQYAALQASSAPALASRDALGRMRQQAEAISEVVRGQVDLPGLLEILSEVLPDSTHLVSLEARGEEVRLTGQGVSASSVVDKLGALPSFSGLRSTSAISRIGQSGEERFSVELKYRQPSADKPSGAAQ